jgi:hypothetical protein
MRPLEVIEARSRAASQFAKLNFLMRPIKKESELLTEKQ